MTLQEKLEALRLKPVPNVTDDNPAISPEAPVSNRLQMKLDALREIDTTPPGLTDKLNKLRQLDGEAPAPVVEPEVVPEGTTKPYTRDDLTNDEFYPAIHEYMVWRFGDHINDMEREEVRDRFLNNMRGVAGGNSVRAVGEATAVFGGTDEEKMIAGKAWEIYENMENLFSDENTWGETIEGVGDFIRAGVVDPVNLVPFAGKLFGGASAKSVAQGARITAQKLYQRELQRKVAKGVSVEAAHKAAEKVGQQYMIRTANGVAAKNAADRAARAAAAKAAKDSVGKKLALHGKSIAKIAGVDATAAVITDALYQSVLMETAVQRGYNASQTLLTGLGTLALAGTVAGAGSLLRRSTGDVGPEAPVYKTSTKDVRIGEVGTKVTEDTPIFSPADKAEGIAPLTKPLGPASKGKSWAEDIRNGIEIEGLDVDFFLTMVGGDSDKDIKGLVTILEEQGYGYKPRNRDDTITNWIGDVIKESDPQEFKRFAENFSREYGIPTDSITKMGQEKFADTFKKKISDDGKLLQVMSDAAQRLGIDTRKIKPEHLAEEILGSNKSFLKDVYDTSGRVVPRFQNQLIRLLVSNYGTTAMNVAGYGQATLAETLTDMVSATLYAADDLGKLARGKKADFGRTRAIAANTVRKAHNMLDPQTTFDQFQKYSELRGSQIKEMLNILPGGVESGKSLTKELDLSPSAGPIERAFDRGMTHVDYGIDFIQKLNLVKAQDDITKSIDFMSNMDKLISMPKDKGGYGMSYNEFMTNPDNHRLMNSIKFRKIEQEAMNTTLSNIFSKGYKDRPGVVGHIAKIIEEARNVPVIGTLVPFGRFFNNTVAFMSDYSGLSLLGKTMGLHRHSEETFGKTVARTAVGWGLIYALSDHELGNIEAGLKWSEDIDPETGQVKDRTYEFPYIALKAAANLLAYHRNDKEVPGNVLADMAKVLGTESLTRSLTDMTDETAEVVKQIINEPKETFSIMGDALLSMGANVSQMATRPLDTPNRIVGALQGEHTREDTRQGNRRLNQATRNVDNLIGLEDEEERYVATRGPLRHQDTKFLSTTRESVPTSVSRVANMIGDNEWDSRYTAIGADFAEAGNRYAELYYKTTDEMFQRLLRNPRFRDADLETRRYKAEDTIEKASKAVRDLMEGSARVSDKKLNLVLDIKANSSDDIISRALEDLGIEVDNIQDLSFEELNLLEEAVKYRKTLLKRR